MIDFILNREFNPKCIALSGLAVALYWSPLPKRSLTVSAGLAIATYISLAWYDDLYGCESRMTSYEGAWSAFFRPFKPTVRMDGEYGTQVEGEREMFCINKYYFLCALI